MLADSSLLYKHSVIMAKLRVCEKRCFLLVWLFDICGLQFGIMREVCCCLVLQFGDSLSLDTVQLWNCFVALSLICVQFALGIWYLYLVFVNFWFCICERESYLDIFGIWVCESASTLICIIPTLL